MADYTPIPIPLRQHWRRFRTRILPLLVFLAAVLSSVLLWNRQSAPAMLVGEVYAPHTIVTASREGILEDFDIQPFQEVLAGEQIGRIRIIPEIQALADLETLRAEIEMIRMGAGDPVLDQQRNLLSWQGLRRDWLLARSDLASLRIRMRQAEADFHRSEKLVGRGAEPQAALEQNRALFEGLVAEETEKSRLVDNLESAVNQSHMSGGGDSTALADGIRASLAWKEAQLRSLEIQMTPVPVIAPFDGHVSRIHRHAGDFVNLGESIIDLRASKPDFIIGYLKQPVLTALNIGMPIEVSPRTGRGTAATASLISIGPQFEPLGLAFVRPISVFSEERALPLLISLPEGLSLRPGELVDLRIADPSLPPSAF